VFAAHALPAGLPYGGLEVSLPAWRWLAKHDTRIASWRAQVETTLED
jgi:hypothetical protein